MKIAIIGAGPAGIIAALTIKQHSTQNEVWLFDGNQKIGRKLFATGNGRCNILNLSADKDSYYSKQPGDLSPVFERYHPAALRTILDNFGIPTEATEDGWVYPISYSAANVVQILGDNMETAGVIVHSSTHVTNIINNGNCFRLKAEELNGLPDFDKIILATGSKAFPQLGANTTILSELFQFGHRDLPFSPALAPFTAKGAIFKYLQGVRMDAEVTLLDGKEKLGSAFGNLIFTDYGLNGPAVMNVSHLVPDAPQQLALQLNLIPGQMKTLLDNVFYRNIKQETLYRSVFLTVLPFKVVEYFFKLWKVDWETHCKSIDSRTFRVHIKRLESGLIPVEGNRGFPFAQAAAGGIPLAEVNLNTMESRKVSGLYFAGEVLDVVGPCGGYNLTWALASGSLAGESCC